MNRREFLTATTAFAAVSVTGGCVRHGATHPTAASDDALLSLTSAQAVGAIRQGDISAESYAAALLARAERLHDLHACISINREGLIEGARRIDADRRKGARPGPVAGLPLRTGAGIAARIAPAGLGTDTGGSVRIPAALCGIVGFRPSVGNGKKRYSTQGVVPLSHTRDTVGPMARTVEDVALLDSVITDEPMAQQISLKGLRLGIPRIPMWEDLDDETAPITESALHRLKAAGAVLVDVDIRAVRDFNPGRAITLYELRGDLEAYLAAGGSGITVDDVFAQVASRDAAEFLADAKSVDKHAYDAALNGLRPRLQKIFADCFNRHALDAMVFPTTPLPARPIKQGGDTRSDTVELNGRQVLTFQTYARNTTLDSAAGLPGLSVPIGLTATGLPVALEFNGPVNSDRTLLGIGMSVEDEFGVLSAPNL